MFNLPSVTYTLGVILISSRPGEHSSIYLINFISCGTPETSVNFTVFNLRNVHSIENFSSQISKSGVRIVEDVFEEP